MTSEDLRLISNVNQYMGINAHLTSHFLHRDPQGWEEFHSDHITDLTRAMNAQLLSMGYIARKERSLQIRYFDDDLHHPVSDILISDLPLRDQWFTPKQDFGSVTGAQAINIPASALLEYPESEVKHPFAIKLYERDEEGEDERGKPVAWIELLSPSNKSGVGYVEYVAKREALLANRLVFVEMDYLHGISTTLEKIPNYRPPGRDQHPDEEAHPYHIWLVNPRLPLDDPHSGAVAAFDVDQPIPTITIPLNHGDRFTFDFNVVYHQTFRAQPAYSLAVDYRQPPEEAQSDYNLRDQVAIAARMLTVQKLKRDGVNLAHGPFPVDLTLLDALRRQPELTRQVLTSQLPDQNGPAFDMDL